ncbi:hypothetical protein, partial [Aquitalea magnusonii]|uniref:hypothetical protein n=1 Tax=Aquitalea magnusonii TaxID=332411 RepID=UPI00195CD2F2
MNHSFIRTALLLGALLLGGFAHAETEDIPLPGDVQSAPLKSAKKSAHHAPASQAHAAGAQRKASKPASRKHHAAGKKHHRQHGKHAAAAKHKAGLVHEGTAVEFPGAAPATLVVIALRTAPEHI